MVHQKKKNKNPEIIFKVSWKKSPDKTKIL